MFSGGGGNIYFKKPLNYYIYIKLYCLYIFLKKIKREGEKKNYIMYEKSMAVSLYLNISGIVMNNIYHRHKY